MSGWDSSRRRTHRVGSGWDEQAAAKRILARDGHRCYYRGPDCIGHATEVDHVTPLSITGPAGDVDSNKRAICVPCHRAKTKLEAAAGRSKRSRSRPVDTHPGLRDAS
jgi:5-methylcytosine-specific restriction protein A